VTIVVDSSIVSVRTPDGTELKALGPNDAGQVLINGETYDVVVVAPEGLDNTALLAWEAGERLAGTFGDRWQITSEGPLKGQFIVKGR
jgi:hypothetical protein